MTQALDHEEEFRSFHDRVSCIEALDHSSRAGNYFFQSLFDQHPEVLTCPWIQYTYSYFVTRFGMSSEVDAAEAHTYWSSTSYFRLAYQEVSVIDKTITSFGSDPSAPIDRDTVRRVFDCLVLGKATISRKQLILASFYAYAAGIGRRIDSVKYILVSDAVTLRTENPIGGFSGKILDAIYQDFPDFKIVFLERDPRASFASCRHQFVNGNGNMYSLSPSTFFARLGELFSLNFHTEGCVWLYWILYQAGAARTAYRLKNRWEQHSLIVRNEDLNLKFIPTIQNVCTFLKISFIPEWNADPYEPTNVGAPWRGKGAYNNQYSKHSVLILENDPDEIAVRITGPNKFVTERWQRRIKPSEMVVLETLFSDELEDLDYPRRATSRREPLWGPKFLTNLVLPFSGEIPRIRWFTQSLGAGRRLLINAIFYIITLPIFYIFSRITLLRIILSRPFFTLR